MVSSQQTFKYPFSIAHKRLHEGGWSREVTVRELAVAKTLAGVNMRLTAGVFARTRRKEIAMPTKRDPDKPASERAAKLRKEIEDVVTEPALPGQREKRPCRIVWRGAGELGIAFE